MECLFLSLFPATRLPSPPSHGVESPWKSTGWKSHGVDIPGVDIHREEIPRGGNPMGWLWAVGNEVEIQRSQFKLS